MLPRGGERRTPNPLFLAHTAALSELFVTLWTRAQETGLRLRQFRREGEARETFKENSRKRAIAPDALIVLVDDQERELRGFVEVDLGTMSHARLRAKADLYRSYVRATAWRERHEFLPSLLFLTTTELRAVAFLRALGDLPDRPRRWAERGGRCARG